MKVVFAPDVEEDLYRLFKLLHDEGYLGTYEFALSYVKDIIDYINEHIEIQSHKKAPIFFSKYGDNLKYIVYRRSKRTTWYILFESNADGYLVTYITNNHVEGHYFNIDE